MRSLLSRIKKAIMLISLVAERLRRDNTPLHPSQEGNRAMPLRVTTIHRPLACEYADETSQRRDAAG
jgi:hypothetical protein